MSKYIPQLKEVKEMLKILHSSKPIRRMYYAGLLVIFTYQIPELITAYGRAF